MTTDADDARTEGARVGLCFRCQHASRIVSARGSTFYLCEWSKVDPAFPKYPRLPVVACAAWVPSADRQSPA
jgi:hypothetical protein